MPKARSLVSAPNVGDPTALVALAVLAEEAGWDGFGLWDHVHLRREMALDVHDPFTVLGAVAHATQRLRIGTLVTPVSRKQPWELAKQVVTLDHLSGGRAYLGVGLGEPSTDDFESFGLSGDPAVRAGRLDEGLAIVDTVLRGDPVRHAGTHWQIDADLHPAAVQRPRPPVWCAGVWPHTRPLVRSARWDGYVPIGAGDRPLSADEVADTARRLGDEGRTVGAGFDLVVPLMPAGPSAAELSDAGATWVVESAWPVPGWLDDLRRVVVAGPP